MFYSKLTAFFFVLGCLLVILNCTQKEEYPIRLITFKGEFIIPYSKFTGQTYGAVEDHFATFPTQNGDLILCGENWLTIWDDLADTLLLQDDDSLLYINSKVSAIMINNSHPSPGYFAQLSDDDIRHLRYIQFNEPLTETYKLHLKKIAQLKPNLDLCIFYDSVGLGYEDLRWLSQYFTPRSLIILSDTDSIRLSTLANLTNLETLVLGLTSSSTKGKLPNLKLLKNLIVLPEKDTVQLAADFFNENLQLERLSFLNQDLGITDLPPWHQLKNLRELNILLDSMTPYSIAQHHPKLQSLSINTFENVSTFGELRNLKWLALGKNVAERDLDLLANAMPNLELLNILNTDSLKNYTTLKKLSMLKYLLITEKPGLDTTLNGLTGLTYLSLPADVFQDTLRLNTLQRALPKTIISPNSGLCMGSGWLLLLIPLTGIFIFLQHYFSKTYVIKSTT